MIDIIHELEWRGLLADCTDPDELQKRLSAGPVTLYCGFDPTADSLHVGNLVPLLALRRFQLAGHRPIALAGGATGLIGDPSGKSAERNLLTHEILQANIQGVSSQLSRFLDFENPENPALLLNNADWTAPVSFLDFLRDTGKHFSINMMVQKESVKSRMEDRASGISYTEFSYMLLQAFDFQVLQKDHNCDLQIGGSDQWGNITAGIDLCRKKNARPAFGLTLPLITNADGSKFGKSVDGAVWLDPARTSPYRFYQFWINTDDRDVIKFLKFFTFLDRDQIAELEKLHEENPGRREAHRRLALEMTTLIHGEAAAEESIKASQILFGGGLEGITESIFREIAGEVPTCKAKKSEFEGDGRPMVDLLVDAGLCPSKGQARKDIQAGGIYLNNIRVTDPAAAVASSDLLFDKFLLLRKGKKNYVVVSVE
jgi:tyrosyl-tRNA synthetase